MAIAVTRPAASLTEDGPPSPTGEVLRDTPPGLVIAARAALLVATILGVLTTAPHLSRARVSVSGAVRLAPSRNQ